MSAGMTKVLDWRNTIAGLSKALDAMVSAMVPKDNPALPHRLGPKEQQACILQAVDDIKPLVHSMLNSNLDASGVKDHSGKLREAVKRANIFVKFGKDKPWRLFILFPNDVTPYVSSTGKQSNAYMVFAAVGHGRVNTRHGTKDFHSADLKKKQAKALRGKKLKALEKGKTSFMHQGNKFDVVPPHPFFFLDNGQKAAIQTSFMVAYKKHADRKTK